MKSSNRDEQHKRFAGIISEDDFLTEQTMCDIANKMSCEELFDERCHRNIQIREILGRTLVDTTLTDYDFPEYRHFYDF